MPTQVNVPLRPETASALRQLAQRELRDPRLQAQWLLEDGLRQAGVLALDRPDGEDDSPAPQTAA
jgi:hypothetical protein